MKSFLLLGFLAHATICASFFTAKYNDPVKLQLTKGSPFDIFLNLQKSPVSSGVKSIAITGVRLIAN